MDLIKLYEEDKMGMAKGKKIESQGIKERETFLAKYPIESIPNLTIEQYLPGNGSFSHWLHYGLSHISKMQSAARPYAFGVYTTKESSRIFLSPSYKEFGSDYEKAFDCLKKNSKFFRRCKARKL